MRLGGGAPWPKTTRPSALFPKLVLVAALRGPKQLDLQLVVQIPNRWRSVEDDHAIENSAALGNRRRKERCVCGRVLLAARRLCGCLQRRERRCNVSVVLAEFSSSRTNTSSRGRNQVKVRLRWDGLC